MHNVDKTLRVMSFNIRLDTPKDEENAWANRKNMAGSIIQFHNIELVGLQEALKHQIQDLAQQLPEYGWVGVGRNDGKDSGEFAPIFYLKARFHVVENGSFWLSETPDIPGSIGWDAANTRICTWAKFLDRQTEETFYFFNTHFDHKGVVAVKESAYLLLEMTEKISGGLPVVVTGDFNSVESSEPYRIITGRSEAETYLIDTRYAPGVTHHGSNFTVHHFKAAQIFWHLSNKEYDEVNKIIDQVASPIDYIFIKRVSKVKSHGFLSDTWDGRYPSDHMPVVAAVEI